MKAKVIATGEILKVADRSLNSEYVWCCKEDGSIIRYKTEEVELIIEKKIDWEQRRFELLKIILQVKMSDSSLAKRNDDEFISFCLKLADMVIAKLKE